LQEAYLNPEAVLERYFPQAKRHLHKGGQK
jgi:hypothetical protein